MEELLKAPEEVRAEARAEFERRWYEDQDEDALEALATLNVYERNLAAHKKEQYRLAKMDAIGCFAALILGVIGMWFAFCFGATMGLN